MLSAVERFHTAQTPEGLFEEALAAAFSPDIRVHASADSFRALNENASDRGAPGKPIEDTFKLIRDGLFYELGILLGPMQLVLDAALEGYLYRFELNGVTRPPTRGLGPGQFFVNDTAERLRLLGLRGTAAMNPANQSESALVDTDEARTICV